MSGTDRSDTHRVLLAVEDNAADARLIRECLKDAHAQVEISVVDNGMAAMAFLRRQGPYEHAPRPGLVLLDLRLPVKSGREVLAEMKQSEDLKTIPVVILTSSDADEDIAACYEQGANCYVTKPMDLDAFAHALQSIADFWLVVARLPKR